MVTKSRALGVVDVFLAADIDSNGDQAFLLVQLVQIYANLF